MKTKKSNRSRSMVRPIAFALACALGLTAGSGMATAQQLTPDVNDRVASDYVGTPILYDRPLERPAEELFMGRTVFSQPAGALQMTIGGSHLRSGDVRNSSVSARAEYGVTDRLQAGVSLPMDIADRSESFDARTGVSRMEVGALYNVTSSREAPVALSAAMDVEVPIGSADNVAGQRPTAGPTYKPAVIVARDLGVAELHASAQAELGQPAQGLNYTVGSMFDLGRVTPTLELNARTNEATAPAYYATPGVYYNFSDRVEAGVGAALGLNDQAETASIMAKVNIVIP